MASDEAVKNRRPLKTRSSGWAKALSGILAKTSITPNGISVIGIGFSILGFAAYAWIGRWNGSALLFLAAACCIQIRLICNLMDGLVAVEAGKSSPTGVLFNEAPDRLEDSLFFVGAGLACIRYSGGLELGWCCAVVALGAAYCRVLGGSLGLPQDFCGPMAKQHRMFFLTVGSIAACLEGIVMGSFWSLYGILWLIAIGTVVTIARRLLRIAALLRAKV